MANLRCEPTPHFMQLWHCDDFLVATGVDKLVVDMEVDMVNPSLEKIKKKSSDLVGKGLHIFYALQVYFLLYQIGTGDIFGLLL